MSFWTLPLAILKVALSKAPRASEDKVLGKSYMIIKEFEGLRLTAYRCSANVPTIGYGHTKGVKMSDVITMDQADAFFAEDIKWVEDTIAKTVKVPVNTNQYEAIASLIYNVGGGAWIHSTILRKLNKGDYKGAADEFPRWNKAGGKVIKGLVRRRAAERKVFLS